MINHNVAEMLNAELGLGLKKSLNIDLSIYQPQRVVKIPYSYDRGNICLPLSDNQFNNFIPEMVSFKFVSRNIKVMNRGLLLRTHCLDTEKLIKNTADFIKYYFAER